MRKSLIFALCTCILLIFCGVSCAEPDYGYELGNKLEDFSVTTITGETFSLYETLKEKDMVLINIWASWCGPCRNEFPHMQEAYEAYKENIEIIALSCEPTDTAESLTTFADNLSLTFPIAQDTVNLSGKFEAYSIPTSIVVDRYGVICFKMAGAMPSVESFTRLFDAFVGSDYEASQTYTSLPDPLPSVQPTDPAFLKNILGLGTGRIEIRNPEDKYTWPMIMSVSADGFFVVSANTGVDGSVSQLDFVIDAVKGEVFKLSFSLSSETMFDFMRISVNGETVKVMSGERTNMSYAVPFNADGEYTVSVTYEKDSVNSAGSDTLTLHDAYLLSGEAAEKALSENPAYPASADEITFTPVQPETKKIVFTDPNNVLPSYFGEADYYITHLDEASFSVQLSHDLDPEAVFGYSTFENAIVPAFEAMDKDAYIFTTGIDSVETTGYIATLLSLYLSPEDHDNTVSIVLLRDEAAADLIVNQAIGKDLGAWQYAEEDTTAAAVGPVSYTLVFKDENGAPVAGVMAQVCTDEICMVYASDENGLCTFTLDPYAYEVHILKAPAGYQADDAVYTLSPAGGETGFVLFKE